MLQKHAIIFLKISLHEPFGGILYEHNFCRDGRMYKNVVKKFHKIELQEWKAEGAMIELSKQVGELAKQESYTC